MAKSGKGEVEARLAGQGDAEKGKDSGARYVGTRFRSIYITAYNDRRGQIERAEEAERRRVENARIEQRKNEDKSVSQ